MMVNELHVTTIKRLSKKNSVLWPGLIKKCCEVINNVNRFMVLFRRIIAQFYTLANITKKLYFVVQTMTFI